MADDENPPFRILPAVTPENEHFWTGGAHGELRFLRCKACGHWIHPPGPVCPACLGREIAVDVASGRGKVHTFTVNHQAWIPGFDPPYVVAIVELPEQDGLRLTTNVVGVPHDEVRIGLAVEVTFEAALAAIADAGLDRDDIDGVATYPGVMGAVPGFSGVGVTEIQEALRLELDWFAGGPELPGQLGSVVNAVAAVAAGLADHVLCFRTVWEASAAGDRGRASVTLGGSGGSFRATGFMEWALPFGAPSAANWIGMMAQRHMHEFGTTREQLAQVALNGRANAARNPHAIYRDPMTLEDYLGAPMISTPLGLYDCDVPADGSTAVIVSRADSAADLRRPPVRIEAMGSALHGRPSWDQFDDLTTMALRDASSMMWSRTDLTAADVDVAQLYDGFSFITLCWLEALGFCGKGEGGAFLADGRPTPRRGSLPLNTNGGQLSGGRLHGYGFLHEACLQLWGEAGERQVDGRPETAVAAAGGGPLASCLLLAAS